MASERRAGDWLLALLRAQRDAGFVDLAGADVALTLPVGERLINRVIADRLPRGGAVSAVDVQALAGNQFSVRVRLGQSSLVPPLHVRLAIDRQPDLPSLPVIRLRVVSPAIALLAGPLVGFFKLLPSWMRIENGLVSIDLLAAAAGAGGGEAFGYLRSLAVTTAAGRVIVSIRASVPATPDGR